jgi:hypothetical protein
MYCVINNMTYTLCYHYGEQPPVLPFMCIIIILNGRLFTHSDKIKYGLIFCVINNMTYTLCYHYGKQPPVLPFMCIIIILNGRVFTHSDKIKYGLIFYVINNMTYTLCYHYGEQPPVLISITNFNYKFQSIPPLPQLIKYSFAIPK